MRRILFSAIICIPFFGFGQNQSKTSIKAGFSEIGITPDKPVIMSGYGNRKDPFSGIHDSIYAQAMYLSQGEEEVLLITSGLIGHSHQHVNMLKEMIRKETGIAESKIFVTATHNHGGPDNATYATLERLPDDERKAG